MLVRVEDMGELCFFVVPADAEIRRVKHFAQLVADEVDDCLEVELGGQSLLDRVYDRELGVALLGFLQQTLRFVEQPGVLERDPHACRHGAQQPRVGDTKGVLAFVILDDDAAEITVTAEDRDEDARQAAVRAFDRRYAVGGHVGAVVVDLRLMRRLHPCAGTARTRRMRLRKNASPVLVLIQISDEVGLRIAPADTDVLGAQHLAQLVTDKIDNHLKIEPRCQPVLDGVDDREFGVALIEQPTCCFEACVRRTCRVLRALR